MTKSSADSDAPLCSIYLDDVLIKTAIYADEERGVVLTVLDRFAGTYTCLTGKVRIEKRVLDSTSSTSRTVCPHCLVSQKGTDRCDKCERLIG